MGSLFYQYFRPQCKFKSVLEASHYGNGQVCLQKAGSVVQMPCLLLFRAAPPAIQGSDPPLYGILFPHLGGLSLPPPTPCLCDQPEKQTETWPRNTAALLH